MTAVLLTRPSGRDDPLAAELEARGVKVHAVPAIRIVAAAMPDLELRAFDWVVVTSGAGVRALAAACDLSTAHRWAAVGPGTAAALAEAGVQVAAIPEVATGTAIAGALGDAGGSRVLLARGDLAGPELPRRLRAAGADVVEVIAYRTEVGPPGSRDLLARALFDPELQVAVYASSSALRGVLALAGEQAATVRAIPVVSIGPRTTVAAQELGFRVVAEASSPAIRPLLQAVLEVIEWQSS